MIDEPKKSEEEIRALKNLATVVYLLQTATIPLVVTYFIAPLLVYWQRKRAKGTWLESHFRWQINTFWFGLAGFSIGVLTLSAIVQVGSIILAATLLWSVYRIGQGWTRLSRGQAMFAVTGPDKAS